LSTRDKREGRKWRINQRPNQCARVLGQKAINFINKVQPHYLGKYGEKNINIDMETNCVFY